MQVKVHPSAEIFPMMSEEQYQALKSDMAIRGQQEGIVFWKGELVDGRNRLKACKELKLEPNSFELDENDDPVAYVISANLHRRHLTTPQRGMVAAKMATLKNGEAGNGRKVGGQNCLATSDAATLLQVSEGTVKNAKQVIERGSKELVQAVERNEVNLNQALKLVKAVENKTEQTKIVRNGKEAIKAAIAPVTQSASIPDPKPTTGKEDSQDYDYPVVKAFEHCDYRVNTLRRMVDLLSPQEKQILSQLLLV